MVLALPEVAQKRSGEGQRSRASVKFNLVLVKVKEKRVVQIGLFVRTTQKVLPNSVSWFTKKD